jgi:hypothetical protein
MSVSWKWEQFIWQLLKPQPGTITESICQIIGKRRSEFARPHAKLDAEILESFAMDLMILLHGE